MGNLRLIFKWILFIALCCGWGYVDWTVRVKVRSQLYYDSRYNIPKGGQLWGWAYYDKNKGEVVFRIGNSGRQGIDFKDARYFMVINKRTRHPLELIKRTSTFYPGEVESTILRPFRGEFGLLVRCKLPEKVYLYQGNVNDPKKIWGFDIVLKGGEVVSFGYEDLNYLQKLKRFFLMKEKELLTRFNLK